MSDIRLIDDCSILFKRTIVLYGASSTGFRFCSYIKKFDIKDVYLCDSNQEKWGTNYDGTEIISPEQLKSMYQSKELTIIISSVYVREIYEFLLHLGIKSDDIFSSFSAKIGLRRYLRLHRGKFNDDFFQLDCMKDELYNAQGKDQSYQFDSSLDKVRYLRMLDSDNQIVLAFQPSKVGSTSIFESLNVRRKYYTVHFHDIEMLIRNNNISYEFWEKSIKLRARSGNKIKIISGVRNPIIRDLSSYYQVLWAYDTRIYDLRKSYMENVILWMNSCVSNKEVSDIKNASDYFILSRRYGIEFDWYVCELEKFFGVNIFDKDFDQEAGYQVYSNDYVEVFVYQLEKLDRLTEELRVFLNDESFEIINANDSSSKIYWKLYRETRESFELSQKYIDFYYEDNKIYDYFYNKKDQRKFLENWKIKESKE